MFKYFVFIQDGVAEGYDFTAYSSLSSLLSSYQYRFKSVQSLLKHLKDIYTDAFIIYVKEGSYFE